MACVGCEMNAEQRAHVARLLKSPCLTPNQEKFLRGILNSGDEYRLTQPQIDYVFRIEENWLKRDNTKNREQKDL